MHAEDAQGSRRFALGVYGFLALSLVCLLLFRENDHEASLAHQGFIGLDDVRFTRQLSDALYGVLAGLTGLGLVAHGLLTRHAVSSARWYRRTAQGVLTALLLLSAANWLYLYGGVTRPDYAKVYDVYHYFLGPKYYDELGYFGLYECSVVADAETLHFIGDQQIRDLGAYRYVDTSKVRARSRCKEHFTPERWEEFKHDYSVIVDAAGPAMIRGMIRDYGYNGTPFQGLVAGAIANSFTLDYDTMILSTLIDTLAVCAMLAGITAAFGWQLGSLVAIGFFTAFSDRFFYIGGSFFRYHWMFLSGFGLLALTRRRYVLSGVLFALAAMLNIFPVLFLLGIGGKGALQFARTRRLEREHVRFTLATMATAATAFLSTFVHARGLENWREFLGDMGKHSQLITVSRIGFRYLLLFRGEFTPDAIHNGARAAELKAIAPAVWGLTALGLFVIILLLPRLSDLEATVMAGFGSFFLLFGTVEYYFGIYAYWILLFARYQRERAAQLILALPFLCGAGVYWYWDRSGFLAFCNNYLMSLAIMLFVSATWLYLDRQLDGGSPRGSRLLRAGVGLLWIGLLAVTALRWPS
ncbi:MAG: hypothetical protein QM778_36170 [Myxococcales bacterium]